MLDMFLTDKEYGQKPYYFKVDSSKKLVVSEAKNGNFKEITEDFLEKFPNPASQPRTARKWYDRWIKIHPKQAEIIPLRINE